LLPTPSARDAKGTSSRKWRERSKRPSTLPDAVALLLGAGLDATWYLTPPFVEEVMGFEAGWTDAGPAPSETP
jgi:hypothetical protein